MNTYTTNAPPERCEVLWFEQAALPGHPILLVPLHRIPEFIALEVVALMQEKGFRFVHLGSSKLPEVEA